MNKCECFFKTLHRVLILKRPSLIQHVIAWCEQQGEKDPICNLQPPPWAPVARAGDTPEEKELKSLFSTKVDWYC